MTKAQRDLLDTIPLDELERYVSDRWTRQRLTTQTASSMPCPYATIPGEKACDMHDYTGCRWRNGPPSS